MKLVLGIGTDVLTRSTSWFSPNSFWWMVRGDSLFIGRSSAVMRSGCWLSIMLHSRVGKAIGNLTASVFASFTVWSIHLLIMEINTHEKILLHGTLEYMHLNYSRNNDNNFRWLKFTNLTFVELLCQYLISCQCILKLIKTINAHYLWHQPSIYLRQRIDKWMTEGKKSQKNKSLASSIEFFNSD